MDARDKAEVGARSSAKPKTGGRGIGESMFSTEGSQGIKVSAKQVLVLSLAFISIVVVLHFIDKLSA